MTNYVQSDKNNYKILGILIRSERINQGYSLRDLGEKTNISHTLISNIEKGKQIPAPDTLADIFKILNLDFYDDPVLLEDLSDKSEEIYNFIFNQDYEQALILLKELEVNENIFLYSLEVVNYIILKCFYYAITNTPEGCMDDTLDHYDKVLEFFNENQKQMFYFVKGLNHLNQEHFTQASEYFYKALKLGRQELDVFIKEYLISSLIKQYKLIDAYRFSQEVIKEYEERTIYNRVMKSKLQVARIFYHIAKHEETEELVLYVDRFAKKFKIEELISDCAQLKAAVAIRLKEFDKATELISLMPNPNSKDAILLLFKIAFVQDDLVDMEMYYNKMKKYNDITKNEKIWMYTTIQVMSKIEHLYNKEEYIDSIKRLVEIASKNNDQEMIGISHNYLIMHYHEHRSYKKALEISEKLLHLKKIRLENE